MTSSSTTRSPGLGSSTGEEYGQNIGVAPRADLAAGKDFAFPGTFDDSHAANGYGANGHSRGYRDTNGYGDADAYGDDDYRHSNGYHNGYGDDGHADNDSNGYGDHNGYGTDGYGDHNGYGTDGYGDHNGYGTDDDSYGGHYADASGYGDTDWPAEDEHDSAPSTSSPRVGSFGAPRPIDDPSEATALVSAPELDDEIDPDESDETRAISRHSAEPTDEEDEGRRIVIAGHGFRPWQLATGGAAAFVVIAAAAILGMAGNHKNDMPAPTPQPAVQSADRPDPAAGGVGLPEGAPAAPPPVDPAHDPTLSDPTLSDPALNPNSMPAAPPPVMPPSPLPSGPLPSNQLPGGPPMPYGPDPALSDPSMNDPTLNSPPSQVGPNPTMDNQMTAPPPRYEHRRREPDTIGNRLRTLGGLQKDDDRDYDSYDRDYDSRYSRSDRYDRDDDRSLGRALGGDGGGLLGGDN